MWPLRARASSSFAPSAVSRRSIYPCIVASAYLLRFDSAALVLP